MRKFDVQRGKVLPVERQWVEFVVRNPDIITTLSSSPLRVRRTAPSTFEGNVFGVKICLKELAHESGSEGVKVRILGDVRMPLSLGRTYTVAEYTMLDVGSEHTAIDVQLSMEVSGLMSFYLFIRRGAVEEYLNHLCEHVEYAAKVVSGKGPQAATTLDIDQQERIESFRQRTIRTKRISLAARPRVLGHLRFTSTSAAVIVGAEVRLTDGQIMSGQHEASWGDKEWQDLGDKALLLGKIKNDVLRSRGQPVQAREEGPECAFRQAALDFGYGLFRKVCAGELLTVLPAVLSHGMEALLRLRVDGPTESWPWESLHDGHDFVALRIPTCREVATITAYEQSEVLLGDPRILIIGADSRGDLPGCEAEAKDIGEALCRAGLTAVEVLDGAEANRNSVLRAVNSGRFSILHFSGHSSFNAAYPFQSSLELAFGTRIFLHELSRMGLRRADAPCVQLAFLNSCESAAVGLDGVTGRQLSLCKALRESGVSYVIGMQWDVDDDAATQLGATFYQVLLENLEVGPVEAMRRTRQRVAVDRAWADGSWLAPVLYA